MYLAKVAMDIMAKKTKADRDGVRIAELDEMTYRRQLWDHRPITDFWRVGRGIARAMETYGIDTMGKVARMSEKNEELLYNLFGVNAELLIDHAWGWEPCTMDVVKAYRPETSSFSSGQVLTEPYTFEKARVVIKEMADSMALKLVSEQLVTNQVTIYVGYDAENLKDGNIRTKYHGDIKANYYGKMVPKHAHGSTSLPFPTSSTQIITDAVTSLFDNNVNPILLIRRLNITVNNLKTEKEAAKNKRPQQLDLFCDYEKKEKEEMERKATLDKEHRIQEAQISIKRRFGKNAILRGLNFQKGATTKERNNQIGGHKA
jgi:DNA polymerase V